MKRALQAVLLALLCSVHAWGVSCPAGYSYYKTVTIPAATGATQTNFPILISGTDANLKVTGSGGHVQSSSGYDLVVGDSSGTVLNFERETWTSGTGALNLWFMLSSYVSSGSTVRYLYYGNSGISSDQQQQSATWDTSFKSVYHFSSAGALSLADSTGTNALTNHNTATLGTGQIGGSVHFVASSSQALSGANPVTSGNLTIAGWIKTTDKLSYYVVYDNRGNTGLLGGVLYLDTSGHANWYINNKTALVGSTDLSGAWHYVVGTWDGTTLTLYVDGVSVASSSGGSFGNFAVGTGYIGVVANGTGSYNPNTADFTNGDNDEIRISGTNRSANWIASEYNNMTTAVTIGSETSCGGTLYTRTASDGSLSESAGRLYASLRGPADGTLSEALARSGVFGRVDADGTVSEAIVRLLGANRMQADGSLSESMARGVVNSRQGTDGTLSEAVIRSHGMFANLTDGSFSESAARLFAAIRAATDSSLSESMSRLYASMRTGIDGTLSESMGRGVVYGRVGNDGTLSEAATRAYGALRAATDGSLGESTARQLNASRSAADGSVAETLGRVFAALRSASDGSLAEVVSRSGAFYRTAGDTGFVSVVVIHGHAFVINISDGSLSETLGRAAAYSRTVAGLNLSEVAMRYGAFNRVGTDSAFMSVSVAGISSGGSPPIVVPLDHQAVYEGIGKVSVYRGFVRDGIYTKPVTVIVVTK